MHTEEKSRWRGANKYVIVLVLGNCTYFVGMVGQLAAQLRHINININRQHHSFTTATGISRDMSSVITLRTFSYRVTIKSPNARVPNEPQYHTD